MMNTDISNIWGEISLPDLLGLEAEVFAAHMALTEDSDGAMRQHRLPALPERQELDRILDAAERIRNCSGVLVVLSADAGALGARAGLELLRGTGNCPEKPAVQVLFAGNSFSVRQWQELTRRLEGKEVSLCVISGSGEDLEPLLALRNLRWLLERRYGTEEAKRRIYAVTGSRDGALGRMAEENGWEMFLCTAAAGGECSALSAAGLLPMAVAGVGIGDLLRGAREAAETQDLRSYENPAWLYAAARELLRRRGKKIELLEASEPGFSTLGRWWQRLFASAVAGDGQDIFPVAAQLPADHRTLGYRITDGERNLFSTALRFEMPEQGMLIGSDVRDPEGLNYLAGRDLTEVEEQAWQEILEKRVDEGIGVICLECGGLNAETLGELFWFFELSRGLSACLMGAHPAGEGYRGREALERRLGKPQGEEL